MKKIIAIDFDKTLVFNEFPNLENPNMELINFIKEHRDEYIFILWTCRHGIYLKQAVKYLWQKFDIKFDYVNKNVPALIKKYGDTRKICADYYIDDKNLSIDNWKNILLGEKK